MCMESMGGRADPHLYLGSVTIGDGPVTGCGDGTYAGTERSPWRRELAVTDVTSPRASLYARARTSLSIK